VASLPSIYLRLIAARVRAQLQYRVSFVLEIVGSFFLTFIDFLVIAVIFQHLPALGGWTLGEVAFLYGTSYISFKVVDVLIGHIDFMPQQIQTGAFDMVLIRPLGALFQIITADFSMRHIGSVAQALVVFGISLSLVEIDWSIARLLALMVMLVSGGLIFAAIWIMGATTTFWTVRTMEMVNAITYGGNLLTSFPLSIYGSWFRRFFAFVIPLAFVNYFPSLYILDKADPLGMPGAFRFLSPLVAVAMAFLAWHVWNIGVRHYRSTGS
jgi:ABC-2 type transport system permease protein